MPAYLCGGQTVADGEAVDCDLDLALVDHVDDGFGCGVHGDDGHGQSSVCVSSSLLVVVTLHLVKANNVEGLPLNQNGTMQEEGYSYGGKKNKSP